MTGPKEKTNCFKIGEVITERANRQKEIVVECFENLIGENSGNFGMKKMRILVLDTAQ